MSPWTMLTKHKSEIAVNKTSFFLNCQFVNTAVLINKVRPTFVSIFTNLYAQACKYSCACTTVNKFQNKLKFLLIHSIWFCSHLLFMNFLKVCFSLSKEFWMKEKSEKIFYQRGSLYSKIEFSTWVKVLPPTLGFRMLPSPRN